jgi:hypothetical protein
MSDANVSVSNVKPRRKRIWLRVVLIVGAILMLMMCSLVAIPVISPSTGADMADTLRSIVGPEPVAALESLSFHIQDVFNRLRYQASGGQPQISFADSPAPEVHASTNTPTLLTAQPSTASAHASAPTVSGYLNVVDAPSNVDTGWQAFGPTVNGKPIMARAVVQPDPTRLYAQAALVRIDLSMIDLHLVPGTIEPVAAKGVKPFARPGIIPIDQQTADNLIAAFNGGFKAIHGGYGMLTNGITIIPPQANMATLGIFSDGSVKIGAWGRDITATNDLIAFRQNCPLLVDEGQVNPHVNDENHKEWGYTVKNLATTWRSGLGVSQDGRFLIYAAGNSLTVQTLANALQQGGAYYAMQLDINGFYTRFVTYQAASNPKVTGYALTANKLLDQMSGDPALFLHPYNRDFFYITYR